MSKYQALWEYVREKEILIVTLLLMGINVFIRPISVKSGGTWYGRTDQQAGYGLLFSYMI